MRLPRLIVLAAFVALATLASAATAKRYVVSDHGALGDGTTVNTQALQALIDRCAADGGGVIVVPKGTFVSGALFFKQGVDLFIEKDGVLKSTTKMADFPIVYTRWEGIERYWTCAFLNFIGMHDVNVSGEGLIDGSGDTFESPYPRFGRRPSGAAAGAPGAATPQASGTATPATASADAPRPPRPAFPMPPPEPTGPLPTIAEVYGANPPHTGALFIAPDRANLPVINAAGIRVPRGQPSPPRAVIFQNCKNVRVSNVGLKNQARWGWVFLYSEDIVAEKLIVRAEHNIPSSDSMDVDSCRRMLITGCDFDCNDDCLSIKSGKDEDGRRVNRPSEDIIVEKTRFAYGHGGAAMGSETSGGIRNVEIRDCVAEAENWAPVRFKSQPSRGGVVENITYRNFELRGTRQAVEFNLAWNMRINVAGDTRVPPTVRNVKLINVRGTVRSAGVMMGLPDSEIDGVTFENCDITAERGLTMEYVRNVDTSGLTLHVANGEPIVRRQPAQTSNTTR
jgi:polygalacturonase